jgi:hypothetical protein
VKRAEADGREDRGCVQRCDAKGARGGRSHLRASRVRTSRNGEGLSMIGGLFRTSSLARKVQQGSRRSRFRRRVRGVHPCRTRTSAGIRWIGSCETELTHSVSSGYSLS